MYVCMCMYVYCICVYACMYVYMYQYMRLLVTYTYRRPFKLLAYSLLWEGDIHMDSFGGVLVYAAV